jgi:hypothetical protein
LKNPRSSGSSFPKLILLFLVLGLALHPSCGGKQESAPPKPSRNLDLAGEWHSDIESADRAISKSVYTIAQRGDTVAIELVSTKSPAGGELVPEGMRFEAAGVWRDNAIRFEALYWISGRDSCTFQLRGDIDKEGRLLLHFPADLCGVKSLPYTRALYRPEAAVE